MTVLLRLRSAPALNILVIGLASLVAALPLAQVYGDWTAWLVTAGIASSFGSVTAALSSTTPLPVSFAVLLAEQCVVGPVVTHPETVLWRVVPTWETLVLGIQRSATSFKHLLTMPPPIGTAQGSLMATWTLVLWCSFLTTSLACMTARWSRVVVVLIVFSEVSCSALLGTREGFLPAGIGTGLTLAVVAWASWGYGMLDTTRWVSIVTIGACALTVGMTIVNVPSHRFVLRDHYQPPVTIAGQASPLSSMRAFVKDHKTDELVTVTGLPEKTPLRLAVLDAYDGVIWNLSSTSGSATFRRIEKSTSPASPGSGYTARIELHDNLGIPWLPLVGRATAIDFPTHDAKHIFFNEETDTVLAQLPSAASTTYTVSGTTIPKPNSHDVARAHAAHIKQPQPQEVPEALTNLARMWAGSESPDGQAALNLTHHLHDEGWFSHGLASDFPSLPGHSASRMSALIEGPTMVGDSEQYASALALMTRTLGIPSRIVLGFVPKGPSGQISARRTHRTANGPQTIFTGNDIEAWVEVNLESLGWVPLFPTPEETKTPDKNDTSAPLQPQNIVRQPSVPLSDPPREEPFVPGTSVEGPDESRSRTTLWERASPLITAVALYGTPVWFITGMLLVILGIRTIDKWERKHHGSAKKRIIRGWDYLILLSQWKRGHTDSHDAVSQNRLCQARAIEDTLDLTPMSLAQLQRLTDDAAFGPYEVTATTPASVWKAVEALEKKISSSSSFTQRLRLHFSLRGLWSPKKGTGRNQLP